MRRSFAARIACVAILCMACTAVFAQEFSADMVSNEGRSATEHTAKIYVIKNKMRVDGMGDKTQQGSVVMNYDTQMITIIMPQQHMYMETRFDQGPMAQQQHKLMFFQAIDVENACPDWHKMTDKQGGSCTKVGDDSVNGRSAVKYTTTDTDGKTGTVWIDKSLRFPIKWETKDGAGELKNIQEGSQPSSLFEPPAGYQKFDMSNMMNRH